MCAMAPEGLAQHRPETMSVSKPPPSGPFQERFRTGIVWQNVAFYIAVHLFALYGVFLVLSLQIRWQTFVFSVLLGSATSQGLLAGVHRYYAHRTFQAKLPLQLFFIFWNTLASQNCIFTWVRDHRLHHKHSDTDADPHNATRGFFFAHIGWLMMRKHPEALEKGRTIDMTDLLSDPLVMFQKRFYYPFSALCYLLVAILLPVYGWHETLINSFFVPALLRTVVILHITWLVNSAAHYFGTKPYDRNIWPMDNVAVAALTFGEGWHNYHHAFPKDYRAAEFGYRDSVTTKFIDLMARLGLAYDLKWASASVVKARALRTGDGSIHRRSTNKQCSSSEQQTELSTE